MFRNLHTEDGNILKGARCHSLGHTIGIAAVENGESPEDILTNCSTFCGFGCLSGASHSYILKHGDIKLAEDFCNTIVEGIGKDTRLGLSRDWTWDR